VADLRDREANTEAVRRFFELINEGGGVDSAWLGEMAADDIVWEVEAMHLPDVGRVEGKDAVLRAFESWRAPWDRVMVTIHGVEEIDRFVVCHYSHEFVQDESGLHFEGSVAVLAEFRDEKVVRMHWYWDADEARAAAKAE
jgi:ketosteroid isomerase-like protein